MKKDTIIRSLNVNIENLLLIFLTISKDHNVYQTNHYLLYQSIWYKFRTIELLLKT